MNIEVPKVTIASLNSRHFATLRLRFPTLEAGAWEWLRQLHEHAATPAHARRARTPNGITILDAAIVEAISAPPWWRIVVVKLDDTFRPIPDPEVFGHFVATTFEPAIDPPQALVEAIDAMSGFKITNRQDGGPKPEGVTT